MSSSPFPPPGSPMGAPAPQPQPSRGGGGLTRTTIILLGVGAFVVLGAAAAIGIGIAMTHSGDDAKEAKNAALYKDYVDGKLPASAYQTTVTRTDANGNVSTTTEDAPAQGGDQAMMGGAGGDAGAAGWGGGSSANYGGAGSSGSGQRVSLADPGVGMQDAMSLTLPAGWQFRGDISRSVPCSPGDAYPEYTATSGDGQSSVTLMTPFFTTSMPTTFDMRTCGVVAPLMSTAEILAKYVAPRMRGGAQIGAPEPVPGLENLGQGGGGNGPSDAARVRVSYSQNGQSFEEYIVGVTTATRMQGGGVSATTVFVYKAPAGKLDGLFQQAVGTMQMSANPDWQQRNASLTQQQTAQAQRQGDQQRAAILQNGQDGGAAGRAMLARTRDGIAATGAASMNAAADSEAKRHSGAVGMMDHVGDRAPQVYVFCNANGGYTTNNNPNPPGAGWYACR